MVSLDGNRFRKVQTPCEKFPVDNRGLDRLPVLVRTELEDDERSGSLSERKSGTAPFSIRCNVLALR